MTCLPPYLCNQNPVLVKIDEELQVTRPGRKGRFRTGSKCSGEEGKNRMKIESETEAEENKLGRSPLTFAENF